MVSTLILLDLREWHPIVLGPLSTAMAPAMIDHPFPQALPIMSLPHPHVLIPAARISLQISEVAAAPLVRLLQEGKDLIGAVPVSTPANSSKQDTYQAYGCRKLSVFSDPPPKLNLKPNSCPNHSPCAAQSSPTHPALYHRSPRPCSLSSRSSLPSYLNSSAHPPCNLRAIFHFCCPPL